MHIGVIVILAIVVSGAIMGLRRRHEINSLRQPKNGWHQGHKLYYRAASEPAKAQPRKRTRPLSERELEELGVFFGDSPEDYD